MSRSGKDQIDTEIPSRNLMWLIIAELKPYEIALRTYVPRLMVEY